MSQTSKSPRAILPVARAVLLAYSHKSSPMTFTQPQVCASLALMSALKMDHRGAVHTTLRSRCNDVNARSCPTLDVGGRARSAAQYESEETTSPPAMEMMAHQVGGLMVDLTARTEPSIIRQLATPEWRLPAVIASSSLSELNEE
jgi:hypothetical protein